MDTVSAPWDPVKKTTTTAALGSSDPQVRAHIRALRAIDVPWSEIEETILQTTPYAGIPRAVNAMKVLREEQEADQ